MRLHRRLIVAAPAQDAQLFFNRVEQPRRERFAGNGNCTVTRISLPGTTAIVDSRRDPGDNRQQVSTEMILIDARMGARFDCARQ